jgi:non-homologous end joining protein Ku
MLTSAKRWASEDIMKGYKVDTDSYIEVTKDELENIARSPPSRREAT